MQSSEIPLDMLRGAHTAEAWEKIGITASELRSPLLERPQRGRYAWAATDAEEPIHRAKIAASVLSAHRAEAVGGWAAARLLGVEWLDGEDSAGNLLPVQLCLQRERRIRRPDLEVLRSDLSPGDIVVLSDGSGMKVTSPVRTAFDLARMAANLTEAVVHLDAMARWGVAPANVLAYAHDRPGWKGVGRVREAAVLATGRVRSPWESRFRMLWVLDAMLPVPFVNAVVLNGHGDYLGEFDLVAKGMGLASEYDGADHADATARARDTVKREGVERLGMKVVRATSNDLGQHRRRTVRRLHDAAHRAPRDGDWHAVERPIEPWPLTSFAEWSTPG